MMEQRHCSFLVDFCGSNIKIGSNFDSGNLEGAKIAEGRVVLTPAFDPMHPQYSLKQSSKTFFHFSIHSPCQVELPITIKRMKILQYFASDEQFYQYYRICIGRKIKKGWNQVIEYEKVLPQDMKRVQADGEYELHFSIKVEQQIYLAYHFPYPFEKAEQFLQELKEKVAMINVESDPKIYLTNELLVESLQGRPVNLLTITSSKNMLEQEESRITKSIFPYYEMEGRPKKFNKPYVLFTARVHSGETSSSFALEGIIEFLISNDKRAELLRQNFVFLIIPVLNPDGVYHGTYRMDTIGHNLNRFYNSAQSHKQPAVFAIQALANYYSSRIVFFMDLHSHPHPNKGSFIYGNCLTEIQEQAETQLYAKILSMESECFGYNWCNFSTNQMNSRDINELLTKDGSARVQLYKILSIPFAYTMQMGYHGCQPKKRTEDELAYKEYNNREKIFTIDDYKLHGKSIVVSLLTLFQINTTNGQKTQAGKYYQTMREQIFKQLIEKQERFRLLDSFAYRKIKVLQQLVYQHIYQPVFKKNPSLQGSLIKKVVLQKRNLIHTISENTSVNRAKSLKKKDLSLNLRQISKTIEAATTREKGMESFKSAFESRERSDQSRFQLIDSRQDNYSFAKMLNLDFNPFPATEKKKIFNIVGNRRTSIKKTIISELQYIGKKTSKGQNFDIDTIDVNSQIEVAQKAYKSAIKYEIISTNRNKVLSNFNQNTYIQNQEDGVEYNDINWQYNDKNEQQKFILPKIGQAGDKTSTNFNIEVQFQRQYDKKYNLRQHKDLTPAHYKVSLRNNGLKMKSLIKPNK